MEQFLQDNWQLLLILVIWTLFWKGLALWRAARTNERWWFIIFMIVQSLGLLEIIYLFVFSKDED